MGQVFGRGLAAWGLMAALAGPAAAQSPPTPDATLAQTLQRAEASASAAEAANARAAASAASADNLVRSLQGDLFKTPTLLAGCTAGVDGPRRFQSGGSGDRRCVVNYLQAQRRFLITSPLSGNDAWPGLFDASGVLSDFYLARSDRHQAILDTGAYATGLGALGASFSTKASPRTVEAWGVLALLGILSVNFTGSDPVRDLHYAGHLGVGYIENRYAVLRNRTRRLTDSRYKLAETTSCTSTGGLTGILETVERWPEGLDKAAVLPVLQRAAIVCRRIATDDFERFQQVVAGDEEEWAAAFATDLLALNSELYDRDASLRATPTAALTAGAVSALRVLDNLISGQDTQEAVNRLRINRVLDNMRVPLTPIRLPPLPDQIEDSVELTPAFAARAGVGGRKDGSDTAPSQEKMETAKTWIREHAPEIEAARRAYNRQVAEAEELRAVAARSVMMFDYHVDTGAADVGLVTPEVAAAAATTPLGPPSLGPNPAPPG